MSGKIPPAIREYAALAKVRMELAERLKAVETALEELEPAVKPHLLQGYAPTVEGVALRLVHSQSVKAKRLMAQFVLAIMAKEPYWNLLGVNWPALISFVRRNSYQQKDGRWCVRWGNFPSWLITEVDVKPTVSIEAKTE